MITISREKAEIFVSEEGYTGKKGGFLQLLKGSSIRHIRYFRK